MRLKGAYIVVYASHETDENGNVTCVHVTYDPATRSGECERKVKGTLHFVPAGAAVPAQFRLYEDLLDPAADPELDFTERLNRHSLSVLSGFVEPAAAAAAPGTTFQFLRVGYFCADPLGTPERPVFNRAVGLKDSFKG